MEPNCPTPKDFTENTLFYVNQEFAIVKNGKSQRRGKVFTHQLEHSISWICTEMTCFIIFQLNLIGRLQLSTERSIQEDNQSIVQLRILRVQEAIIKIMKVRKRLNNATLQVS